MINLNFNNEYKKIKLTASEKKIEAIFSIKYTSRLLLKIVLFEIFTICIFPGVIYLQNGSFNLSEAIIPGIFSFIFLIAITRTKKYLSIYPLKNKASTKQSLSSEQEIKWPKDAVLNYEINYSGEGKILDVLLIAKSDSKEETSIFSFPDLETFELFKELYNSKFYSNAIA